MPHKFIHNDVNDPSDVSVHCYACGVVLDCPQAYEETARSYLPPCPGPLYVRAHHFIFVGTTNMILYCEYDDVRVTETSQEDSIGPCVGG